MLSSAVAASSVFAQTRLEAMETVVARAQEPDAAGFAAVLAQCMAHVPGFDDKNFQVCCWLSIMSGVIIETCGCCRMRVTSCMATTSASCELGCSPVRRHVGVGPLLILCWCSCLTHVPDEQRLDLTA